MNFPSIFSKASRGIPKDSTPKKIVFVALVLVLLAPISLFGVMKVSAVTPSNVVFTAPINLSNDASQAHYPWVASSGNYVYVAWTEEAKGVYIRVSNDNGAHWTPPTTQAATRLSPKGGTTTYPVMAVNGSNVYVVWTQTLVSGGNSEIFVAASNNNGASFNTTAKTVDLTAAQAGIISDIPSAAAYGSNVYIIWHELTTSGFQSVWTIASTNAGVSWNSLSMQQLDVGKTGQATEPQISAWGNDVYASWDRGGAWFGVSTNNGLTWTVKNANKPNTGTCARAVGCCFGTERLRYLE